MPAGHEAGGVRGARRAAPPAYVASSTRRGALLYCRPRSGGWLNLEETFRRLRRAHVEGAWCGVGLLHSEGSFAGGAGNLSGVGAEMGEDLSLVVRIVEEAAATIADADRDRLGTHAKSGRRDMVTAHDVRVQALLVECLSAAFPGAAFQCEEGAGDQGAGGQGDQGAGAPLSATRGLRFVIDPIDGTANFVHGTGQSAVSVALARDDEVLLGVVCDPFTGETFCARAGGGAWLNGRPLRRIADARLEDSLVCMGTSPYFPDLYRATMELLVRRAEEFNDVRRDGSAALDCCYVATGCYGAFFEMSLAPWDVAAGALVARECGAWVGTMEGAPLGLSSRGSVLVAAPSAAAQFLAGQGVGPLPAGLAAPTAGGAGEANDAGEADGASDENGAGAAAGGRA